MFSIFNSILLILSGIVLFFYFDETETLLFEEIPENVVSWEKQGEYLNIFGNQVFVVDYQSKKNKNNNSETLFIIHGFPTSSIDFFKCLPILEEKFSRIVLFDLIGFGLSSKPKNYSYSITEHADTAIQILKILNLESPHLFSHDLGDSVASEILTRRFRKNLFVSQNFKDFKSVTFTNGGMHIELAQFRISQILLKLPVLGKVFSKLTFKALFDRQIQSLQGKNQTIPQNDMDTMWYLVDHNFGRYRTYLIIGYISERFQYQDSRWIPALKELDIPVNIYWGEYDAVAPKEIAQTLNQEIPNSKLIFTDFGHFGMLENPSVWSQGLVKLY